MLKIKMSIRRRLENDSTDSTDLLLFSLLPLRRLRNDRRFASSYDVSIFGSARDHQLVEVYPACCQESALMNDCYDLS